MVDDGYLVSEYFLSKRGFRIFEDEGSQIAANWTQITKEPLSERYTDSRILPEGSKHDILSETFNERTGRFLFYYRDRMTYGYRWTEQMDICQMPEEFDYSEVPTFGLKNTQPFLPLNPSQSSFEVYYKDLAVLDELGGGLIADNNMLTFYNDIQERVDGDVN